MTSFEQSLVQTLQKQGYEKAIKTLAKHLKKPEHEAKALIDKFLAENPSYGSTVVKKKKSRAWIIILAIVAVVFVGGCVKTCSSVKDAVTNNPGIVAHTPTNESPAATEGTWQEVFTFKGSGSKKSASFNLSGGKTKVKYKAHSAGVFAFYIVPEGTEIQQTGGIPDVMTQEAEDSETYVRKRAGTYYIDVNAAGKWEMTVYELR